MAAGSDEARIPPRRRLIVEPFDDDRKRSGDLVRITVSVFAEPVSKQGDPPDLVIGPVTFQTEAQPARGSLGMGILPIRRQWKDELENRRSARTAGSSFENLGSQTTGL